MENNVIIFFMIELNQNQAQENHEIDNDKLWGVLAYILFLIPLLSVKNRSSFLNYHINQGIILLLAVLAGNFGLGFLPFWLVILTWFKGIWNIVMFGFLITGIKNVFAKQTKPLPVIGTLFTFLK